MVDKRILHKEYDTLKESSKPLQQVVTTHASNYEELKQMIETSFMNHSYKITGAGINKKVLDALVKDVLGNSQACSPEIIFSIALDKAYGRSKTT